MTDISLMSMLPDIQARTVLASDEKVIISRAGRPVNVSGMIWKIPDPIRPLNLDWNEVPIPSVTVTAATIAYFKHLVRNYAARSSSGAWYALQKMWTSSAFQAACAAGDEIPYKAISEAMSAFEPHQRYKLSWVRHWFNWCCDQGYEDFSPEVAFRFNELVIGGGPKGQAVQSADPNEGPLVDTEIVAFNNLLRASRLNGVLSLKEQVVLWLCIALGSNTDPIALLREDDFEKVGTADTEGVVYQIRVPRHKKGDCAERMQF
jgi:hypothetical protein